MMEHMKHPVELSREMMDCISYGSECSEYVVVYPHINAEFVSQHFPFYTGTLFSLRGTPEFAEWQKQFEGIFSGSVYPVCVRNPEKLSSLLFEHLPTVRLVKGKCGYGFSTKNMADLMIAYLLAGFVPPKAYWMQGMGDLMFSNVSDAMTCHIYDVVNFSKHREFAPDSISGGNCVNSNVVTFKKAA